MYFTPFSLVFQLFFAFVSNSGKHNLKSLGKDMGMDKLEKLSKKGPGKIPHEEVFPVVNNVKNLLAVNGIRFTEGLIVKLVESSINKFIDSSSSSVPLSETHATVTSNTTRYSRTFAHVGKPTSQRVKRLVNTPLVQFDRKDISESQKDYIQHINHKNLLMNCGFNEKGFSYLMEDTYMSVKDFIQLYRTDPTVEKNLLKTRKGKHDTYGAVYNLHNQLTFTNDMKYYDMVLKLHMVKITDIHNDPRQLIRDTTNTIFNTRNTRRTPGSDDGTEDKKEKKANLRGNPSSDPSRMAEQYLQSSDVPKKVKEFLLQFLNKSAAFRSDGFQFGKIAEDDQYTDPKVSDLSNRFSCSYTTALTCNLTDSINFRDRATIVNTWNRRIGPGSTWELNITQHFGKGLHLNYLYDVRSLNDQHPVGYVFVVEYFGDKRAKITRVETEDCFNGYSPVKLRCQFTRELAYLTKEKDGFDEDVPVVYKRKRQEKDFEEKSPLNEYFSPDRQPYFHIPMEQIDLVVGKSTKDLKPKDYILDYDQNILPSVSLLEQLQVDFNKHKFNGAVTEDDAGYNLKTPPSEREYEGTEGSDETEGNRGPDFTDLY